MSQLPTVRLDTNVTPNQGATSVELIDPSRRPAGARRGRGGAPGAAAARLDAARRADRQPHGVERRRVDRRRARPLGQLRRTARRQAVQGEVHRHRAAEADRAATSSSARACRASIFPTRSPANTSTCSTCACPACCTAASCGRAGSAPTARAPSRSRSTKASIAGHSRRAGRARGRLRRRRRRTRVGRGAGPPAMLKVTWQETPALPGNADLYERMRADQDHRHRHRQHRRCRQGLRAPRPMCASATYQLPVPGPRAVRAELRVRRCRAGRRAGDVLDPGHL